ncbi:MAG TPA: hypothetical protein VK123_09445 [Candidatus Limnocylindrales bacterium]|nr:hypothetical protein [Candidatus Limnocylindrales bacterium]
MTRISAISLDTPRTLRHPVRRLFSGAAAAALMLAACGFGPDLPSTARTPEAHPTLRLDGKWVHNVGRLQLQITNIGETGNADNPRRTNVPCAEWPPGSGNDYLYAAGLWIGALDAAGIPHVTTSVLPEREFSPALIPEGACADLPLDQIADVRESYEGIPGGTRVISSSVNPDDDGDGLVDEDFPNGIDDDGDGLCDEDYGAIGQQMLSCEYFDNIPQTRQTLPEHVPLGVRVRQSSYAWSTPGQNDFVGMDYQIKNISGRTLRNVMIAVFADMDIGNRGVSQYYLDDQAGLINRDVEYIGADGTTVRRRLQMGYMYDNPDNPANPQENKKGDVPGYFGCMFLNHTTDPSGALAPRKVGITSFKFFSGEAPFVAGGDPGNDAQRYQLMTDPFLNPDEIGEVRSTRPLDYRFVMATGPFRSILPESTLTISVAWVMGLGLGQGNRVGAGGTLIENAIVAQQIYDGLYTDFDGLAATGQCGKETCLRSTTGASFLYEAPESSACRVRFWAAIPPGERYQGLLPWDPSTDCRVQAQGRFWCPDGGTPGTPAHCASEDTVSVQVDAGCTYVDLDCNVNTGQDGREHLVNWVAASPLPSPVFPGQNGHGEPRDFLDLYHTRSDSTKTAAWFFPGDRKVTLKWNNFAELLRDAQRGNLKEFAGYRIYKAAGWSRPFGTNGPSRDLWSLLGEWRVDPTGTPARPLPELIDVSAPIIRARDVTVTWDRTARQLLRDSSYTESDTLFAVGRNTFVDSHVLNGFPYFYSIVPLSILPGIPPQEDILLMGTPNAQNSQVVYPRSDAASDQRHVIVVPNPYRAGAEWDLVPREDDPSGTKVTFMNLPRTRGTIRVFTLAGDLVRNLPFDGTLPADLQYGRNPVVNGAGDVSWNLISRNGQKIVSGIYLYCVDSDLGRDIGRFVVIR